MFIKSVVKLSKIFIYMDDIKSYREIVNNIDIITFDSSLNFKQYISNLITKYFYFFNFHDFLNLIVFAVFYNELFKSG